MENKQSVVSGEVAANAEVPISEQKRRAETSERSG
jgi:hypothetical protein